MFAAYFFMANDLKYHEFTAFNILDILSAIGGLLSIITKSFGVIAVFINKKTIMAKFIRSLYFVVKPENLRGKYEVSQSDSKTKVGEYKFINHIITLRCRFYNFIWRKANKE